MDRGWLMSQTPERVVRMTTGIILAVGVFIGVIRETSPFALGIMTCAVVILLGKKSDVQGVAEIIKKFPKNERRR